MWLRRWPAWPGRPSTWPRPRPDRRGHAPRSATPFSRACWTTTTLSRSPPRPIGDSCSWCVSIHRMRDLERGLNVRMWGWTAGVAGRQLGHLDDGQLPADAGRQRPAIRPELDHARAGEPHRPRSVRAGRGPGPRRVLGRHPLPLRPRTCTHASPLHAACFMDTPAWPGLHFLTPCHTLRPARPTLLPASLSLSLSMSPRRPDCWPGQQLGGCDASRARGAAARHGSCCAGRYGGTGGGVEHGRLHAVVRDRSVLMPPTRNAGACQPRVAFGRMVSRIWGPLWGLLLFDVRWSHVHRLQSTATAVPDSVRGLAAVPPSASADRA